MSQPAIGDYDNDGDVEFFFCGRRLWRRSPGDVSQPHGSKPDKWQFSDVTVADELSMAHCYIGGFADVDNDGDLDLDLDLVAADDL